MTIKSPFTSPLPGSVSRDSLVSAYDRLSAEYETVYDELMRVRQAVLGLSGETYGGLPTGDYRMGHRHGVETAKRALLDVSGPVYEQKVKGGVFTAVVPAEPEPATKSCSCSLCTSRRR